ncbi:MAG TPA: hypothetical protein VN671_00995, partial [Solirubrobacterales bacterium]|nr:hypothetical protein [Solirubrobacterales bacterium]
LVAVVDARPAAGELARVLRSGGHLILAATSGEPIGGGVSGWLLARSLRARGFELSDEDRAGNGGFAVLRLA